MIWIKPCTGPAFDDEHRHPDSGNAAVEDNVRTRHHWETVYQEKRFDETSWHQPVPQESLLAIGEADIALDTPVIDIGAGASLLVDHLLDLRHRDLTILDISAAALAQARTRLGDRSKQVSWIEGDVLRFEPERRYGLWHDRAAFHFLTEPGDQQKYVSVLRDALGPGGQAILATFSPRGPKKCSGLDIVQYDARTIRKTLGPAFHLLHHREHRHITPAGGAQWFNYFRILRI